MPKKKLIALSIALLLCLTIAALALSAEFWASKEGNKYHYPTCQYAKKIKSENRIVFKSAAEAKKAGFEACKVCKPPEK